MSPKPSNDAVAETASELFADVVSRLAAATDPHTSSGQPRLFFPNGIGLIYLKVKLGEVEVELKVASDTSAQTASPRDVVILAARELSGAAWCSRFPGSTSTGDLTQSFRAACDAFLSAMRAAGANVSISATYRPPQRAYLMHWAWEIARVNTDPSSVPAMSGVDIEWVHRTDGGAVDLSASRAAAEDMVAGYGMAFPAQLVTRHTQRRAIDMTIAWNGDLRITNADGDTVTITSAPRTGDNTDLQRVGRTYGVIKLVSDPPHWSDDGH